MKFKNSEGEEVRVMSEEKVEQVSSDEPAVATIPSEQSAPLPPAKEESDFLKNFHSTSGTPTVTTEQPVVIPHHRKSFGILKILLLIVLTVFIAVIGLLAAGVRKLYYLIEPHLASEALPIPEIVYDQEAASTARQKVTGVLYGTGSWSGRVTSLTATELNQLIASYQSPEVRTSNKMFVTFPQDWHLRFHRSRKVPPVFPTSLQEKRRLNTIIEIEPTITQNTLTATIHTMYIWSNDITDSLEAHHMRVFSLALTHPTVTSTAWAFPLKIMAIKNSRLYLANQ